LHRAGAGAVRWSAAECLRHLNITADSYFTIWERALGRAREEGRSGEGPFRLDFCGRLMTWMMEPPPKLRLPAPSNFQPVEMSAPERIVPEFMEQQRRIGARYRRGPDSDCVSVQFNGAE